MEKQSELVIRVLHLLKEAGVLDHVLIIGSWCAHFYRFYFKDGDYRPVLQTRDIDFLVNVRTRFPKQIDLEALLKPLGFDLEFYGKGYMKLESDELAIEFLAPEVGPSKDKPHLLPELKLNAQPLRHMTMLWREPIEIKVEDITVTLPHPADYALQKLIVCGERRDKGKGDKDREAAFAAIEATRAMNDVKSLRLAYAALTPSEQRQIRSELQAAGLIDLI